MAYKDYLIKADDKFDFESAKKIYAQNLVVKFFANNHMFRNYELAAAARDNERTLRNMHAALNEPAIQNECTRNSHRAIGQILNNDEAHKAAFKMARNCKLLPQA